MIQSRCAMQWERTQFHSTFCDSESMYFASDRSGPPTRWSFWALNQRPWPQLAIPYMVNFAIFASHPSKYYSSLQYKLIYMLQYIPNKLSEVPVRLIQGLTGTMLEDACHWKPTVFSPSNHLKIPSELFTVRRGRTRHPS